MTRAIVVGSGPNGLVAAVVLARAGIAVHVLEAAATIGGGARSDEIFRSGIVHDHCSAFHPLGAVSPAFAELGLADYGLRWRHAPYDLGHALDDGPAVLLSTSVAETAGRLGRDGPVWQDVFGDLADGFGELAADALGPMLARPEHPLRLLDFGRRALFPATGLSRMFRTEPARALFGGAAAHAFTALDGPGSSAAGLMLLAAGHRGGWPAAEGGSSSIIAALATALIDAGGRISTGTPVTERGRLDEADLVLLDLMPGAAARLLGSAMPARIARAYRRYRHGPAAFKVDYLIDGEVGWRDPELARAGTVHLGGTVEQLAAAEAQALAGRLPERPFVLVGQQWVADPSRAPGPLKPLWAYAHVPHGYSGDASEAVTAQIERWAPGFRERIVEQTSRGPAAFEAGNANYVGGDIGGGRNDLRGLIARPRLTPRPYFTGVDGVYLCSSATPPGGGVHGMCGYHAARAALADLAR
ncbi:phytoene desaturase family protein [Gordonia sp. VNK21]|uniref:phytoene desaturase family protein n=1 Tax=Gordonia sp. VNK21 TaxID=3382483 RepID=UPI0038D4BEBE